MYLCYLYILNCFSWSNIYECNFAPRTNRKKNLAKHIHKSKKNKYNEKQQIKKKSVFVKKKKKFQILIRNSK